MRVSVIIPVHDGAALIAQTIRSVLNQTRPPDEIVVADDGSTDASAEIAAAIWRAGAGDPRPLRRRVRGADSPGSEKADGRRADVPRCRRSAGA